MRRTLARHSSVTGALSAGILVKYQLMKVPGYPDLTIPRGALPGRVSSRAIETLRCPSCGWRDVRFSRLRSTLDRILRKLSFTAFRCRTCGNRFYRYHRNSS